MVKDSDDLPPKFTESIYRTKINEFSPITVSVSVAFDNFSFSTKFLFTARKGKERKKACWTNNGALTKEYRLFYMGMCLCVVHWYCCSRSLFVLFTIRTNTNSNKMKCIIFPKSESPIDCFAHKKMFNCSVYNSYDRFWCHRNKCKIYCCNPSC